MPMISISTLSGILLGFGLCFWAIFASTKDFHIFLGAEAFAIIVGGTIAATLISFRGRYVFRALVSMTKIFITQPIHPSTLRDDIKMMVEWASLAQQQGLGAIEDAVAKLKNPNPFFKYAVSLLLNGYKEADLRLFLGDFIETGHDRKMVQSQILNQMGGHAPAFGMIGTLIGLIIMMSNMGSDPSAIGPAMAISLLATLYGVIAARLVFLPASSKTQQMLEIERFRRYIYLEGVVMISMKRPPVYVQDRLNALVDPESQYDHFKRGRNERSTKPLARGTSALGGER